MKNYYKVLNVKETATESEIRKAYFTLAKEYHPDLNSNDEEKIKRFDEITKAFHFLQSPLNRMGLDAELRAARKSEPAPNKNVESAPPSSNASLAEINSIYANQLNEYELLLKNLLKEASGGAIPITTEKEKEILKTIRKNKIKRSKLN
ncbi:MAG: J domain-containing protein [Clostridia bacterium]|nr:J domain-containing protein [Clostridia bacterium]MBP5593253.1 J domain-containing protein [Clostridia bacterium]